MGEVANSMVFESEDIVNEPFIVIACMFNALFVY